MSMYSPTVVPRAYSAPLPDFAGSLASAFAGDYERKRQAKLDEQARLGHDVTMYEHGVRTGAHPSDDVTITTPAPATFDPSIGWGDVLGGGARRAGSGGFIAEQGPPPHEGHTAMDEDPRDFGLGGGAFDPRLDAGALAGAFHQPAAVPPQGSASPQGLASAFGDPAKSRAGSGANTDEGRDEMSSRVPAAAVHPGAFDPATRRFGGAPSQQMTAALHAQGAPAPGLTGATSTVLRNTNPRYVQLDDGHYIDTFHTPEAERDRDRMEQAHIAADYRRGDIFARGQVAQDLEGTRQGGRLEVIDRRATDRTPSLQERAAVRVGELVSQGVPLEEANRRARNEFAMQPEAPPGNVFVTGIDPATGQPEIFAGKNKGPAQLTPLGVGKPAGGLSGNANNVAAQARLTAAVSEMNNAHDSMAEYERRLASGQVNISGLGQFLARAGSTFTHDDPVSQTVQSAALATLNRVNPDLARYIRRGLSFAEGESMISQRPSDFRTRMAAFLSTAASGASPEMVHDIQSRRTAILTPLNQTVPQMATPMGRGRGAAGAAGTGGTGGAPPANAPGTAAPTGPPGDIDLRSPSGAASGNTGVGKPPLAARVQQLKSLGLSREAAMAQLHHEGYDLSRPPEEE